MLPPLAPTSLQGGGVVLGTVYCVVPNKAWWEERNKHVGIALGMLLAQMGWLALVLAIGLVAAGGWLWLAKALGYLLYCFSRTAQTTSSSSQIETHPSVHPIRRNARDDANE